MKVAFVFPGQGSQYVGMAKEFYQEFPEVRQLFAAANDSLGWNLDRLCFEGPEADLVQTANTQPALLTASIGCLLALSQHGVFPTVMAGHSLGEYTALVAAGALDFNDAVKVVRQRGLIMEKVGGNQGGMAAILGLDPEKVVDICAEANKTSLVEPANFNSPGQVVISGTQEGLARASELAKAAGAKRVVQLSVSGPFHSSLMQTAGVELAEVLAEVTIRTPQIPIMANISATAVSEVEDIRQSLVEQVSGSVKWVQCVEAMLADGVTHFIEIGPGRVLSGLIRKISRQAEVMNVEDLASLENSLAKLGEVS